MFVLQKGVHVSNVFLVQSLLFSSLFSLTLKITYIDLRRTSTGYSGQLWNVFSYFYGRT